MQGSSPGGSVSRPATARSVPGPDTGLSPVGRGTRIPELDALRGIGALAIVGFHLWPGTFFLGWTRVDLFFVLSGYLITTIILRHGSGPRFLVTFWVRRALRIWPAYLLTLAIVCARAVAAGAPPRLDALVAHLTFTQNLSLYTSGTVPPFPPGAGQTWSLAIEEQFYLVWPLALVLGGRPLVVPLALVLIADSVAARLLGLYPVVALARCDGLALGAILAALPGHGARSRGQSLAPDLAFLSIGLAALTYLSGVVGRPDTPGIGRSVAGCGPLSILAVNLLYFSAIGLVIRHTGHRLFGPLRRGPLTYLGRISYGIFLYHFLIFDVITGRFGPRAWTTDAAVVLLTLLAAALSWELFERPIGSLKTSLRYDDRVAERPAPPRGGRAGPQGGRGEVPGVAPGAGAPRGPGAGSAVSG